MIIEIKVSWLLKHNVIYHQCQLHRHLIVISIPKQFTPSLETETALKWRMQTCAHGLMCNYSKVISWKLEGKVSRKYSYMFSGGELGENIDTILLICPLIPRPQLAVSQLSAKTGNSLALFNCPIKSSYQHLCSLINNLQFNYSLQITVSNLSLHKW